MMKKIYFVALLLSSLTAAAAEIATDLEQKFTVDTQEIEEPDNDNCELVLPEEACALIAAQNDEIVPASSWESYPGKMADGFCKIAKFVGRHPQAACLMLVNLSIHAVAAINTVAAAANCTCTQCAVCACHCEYKGSIGIAPDMLACAQICNQQFGFKMAACK
jgi:hypothetical protein